MVIVGQFQADGEDGRRRFGTPTIRTWKREDFNQWGAPVSLSAAFRATLVRNRPSFHWSDEGASVLYAINDKDGPRYERIDAATGAPTPVKTNSP